MKIFTSSFKVEDLSEKSEFSGMFHILYLFLDVIGCFKDKRNNIHEESSGNIFSKEGAKRSIKYFLENTTLHGLKYVAEEKITIPERVFFGLSFIMVIVLSGIFISNVYVKWSAAPIIISTSAKQTLTSDIPFPAITICNLNLALKSKVEKIARTSTNFSLLMSLCDQAGDTEELYRGTWKYFKEILTQVAQPCDSMLLYCRFGAVEENCSEIFNSALTDEGLCCTFNALDQKFLLKNYTDDNRFRPHVDSGYVPIDWTPENGYDQNLPEHFYPRVSGGTGSRMGLTVILNSSSSEYYCSKSKSIGFKVLVHSPAELPKISNYGFLVTAGREARIPIEPIYQDAVPTIRSIGKHVRRCLFSDEGDLAYFRSYSRKNCESECEAKILMELCQCVLYYLPRNDPAVRICGPNDNACTNQVQSAIESSSKNISCTQCWPGCYELNYKATLTSTTIVFGTFMSVDDFPSKIFNGSGSIEDISILNFYYLLDTFRSITKTEVFGLTEFLSNTGGLLGLFMGFSIFSLIEIIFHITVRPYCANRSLELQKKKKHIAKTRIPTPAKRPYYKRELNSWKVNKQLMQKRVGNRNNKHSLRGILLQQEKYNRNEEPIFFYVD